MRPVYVAYVRFRCSLASINLIQASAVFFFFNDTATTEIYTLSLHDALPIFASTVESGLNTLRKTQTRLSSSGGSRRRSEEHTSELQSQSNLVCRLLLEKKKNLPVHDTNEWVRHKGLNSRQRRRSQHDRIQMC